MTGPLRSLVMWLLLLALPVQGFAAATMVNCGPAHHRMSEVSVAVHAGHVHHAEHAKHDLDKVAKFKCSACASCCVGAALAPAQIAFFSPPPAVAPDAFVPAARIGFFTDGPERPPRIVLA